MNDHSSMGASAAAIEHHYGSGNDYFALWLDRGMTYSCALWDAADPEQTLEQAQTDKIEHHIREAHASGAQRVLDVGCGWGSVLARLVNKHGVSSAVGLTLSESQVRWIARAPQDPRIDVRLESWRDHDAEDGSYDAIISIGAFEHFAKLGLSSEEKIDVYRAFFTRCHGWLKSRRWLSLQTVAYGNSVQKDFDRFIGQQIFPETDTPRLFELAAAADRLFEIVRLRNDRDDYRRTLRAWFSRLKARRAEAVAMKGEREVRKFEQYLRLMAYMFEVGGLDLHRVTLRKIDRPK